MMMVESSANVNDKAAKANVAKKGNKKVAKAAAPKKKEEPVSAEELFFNAVSDDLVGLEVKFKQQKYTSSALNQAVEKLSSTNNPQAFVLGILYRHLQNIAEKYGGTIPRNVLDKIVADAINSEFKFTTAITILQLIVRKYVQDTITSEDVYKLSQQTKDANGDQIEDLEAVFVTDLTFLPAAESSLIQSAHDHIKQKDYEGLEASLEKGGAKATVDIDSMMARIESTFASIYQTLAKLHKSGEKYAIVEVSAQDQKHSVVVKLVEAKKLEAESPFKRLITLNEKLLEIRTNEYMKTLMMQVFKNSVQQDPQVAAAA